MTKMKKLIEELIKSGLNLEEILSTESYQFVQEVLSGRSSNGKITENGKIILTYMKDNSDKKEFSAREIAEGIFSSSRSVSGAMRKLISDNYVEKVNTNSDPTMYALTDNGKALTF